MTLETGVKELAEAVGADVKALANGKVDSNDPRLTDAREWTADTVTQAEAEAGTASSRRAWTSQRVRQAVVAAWNAISSAWGRGFVNSADAGAARQNLGLGTAATRGVGTSAGNVLEVGAGGWLGQGEVSLTPLGYPASVADITNLTKTIRSEALDNGVNAFSAGVHFSNYDTWGRLRVAYLGSQAWVQGGSAASGSGWTAELYHSANLLNIGTTSATARTALQLTGEWVDLRPYLKAGFYFDSARASRNSHPRIRKLSCGRVELDGVVNFNETSDPVPIGVFVNVPSEFRPTLTAGGLMFGDTWSPLSFGAVNWIVTGVDEYSPPQVHGDIMMIPLTLTSPSQGGALSLNGIYWFT